MERDASPRALIERTHITAALISRAIFSPCETYRYLLQRRWDGLPFDAPGCLCFAMMNPSTANEMLDDATIRRCIGYAKALGYGGIIIVNAFGFRSTDPRGLLAANDPVGPENTRIVIEAARAADLVICAWGLPPKPLRAKTAGLLARLQAEGIRPHALRLTKDGTPAHPLYLPASLRPFPIGESHAA